MHGAVKIAERVVVILVNAEMTCCSNKLHSATFSMNASILHRATPLTLVFAGSLSEAGSANTCNHLLSSFESNPTKTIQAWLARLFFTAHQGNSKSKIIHPRPCSYQNQYGQQLLADSAMLRRSNFPEPMYTSRKAYNN